MSLKLQIMVNIEEEDDPFAEIDDWNYTDYSSDSTPTSQISSPDLQMFQDDLSDNEAHGDEIRIDGFDFEKFSTFTYYANKRTEVLQVKDAAMKSLVTNELEYDPLWKEALLEILEAKRKQINKAFSNGKISTSELAQLNVLLIETQELINNPEPTEE